MSRMIQLSFISIFVLVLGVIPMVYGQNQSRDQLQQQQQDQLRTKDQLKTNTQEQERTQLRTRDQLRTTEQDRNQVRTRDRSQSHTRSGSSSGRSGGSPDPVDIIAAPNHLLVSPTGAILAVRGSQWGHG